MSPKCVPFTVKLAVLTCAREASGLSTGETARKIGGAPHALFA
jgi:hypothetical protein